ncbi:MAG: hypothetical protein WC389_10910 [Lutibacter sp.]|jgi:hypothetical protein
MAKKEKHTCHQCFKEMTEFVAKIEEGELVLYACGNPACPNYALYQVPIESFYRK